MKNGKKVLAMLTMVMVLAAAGTALAYGGRHHGGRGYGMGMDGYCYGYGPQGGPARPGERGPAWGFDVPQNIRDKQAEAQKLMIDLRTEMYKQPVDKDKALELFRKHRALQNELSEWFFTQRLDAIAKGAVPATPQ